MDPALALFSAETAPQGWLPGKSPQAGAAFDAGHDLPVLGMIGRAMDGAQSPAPLRIASSAALGAATGGPLGIVGSVFFGLIEELAQLGPDTSRPSLPAGMSSAAESGVQPGRAPAGSYITLATTVPDFLGGATVTPRVASDAYGAAMGYG